MTKKHDNLSTPSFFYFEQLASTNSKIRELSNQQHLSEMSLVITPQQYAGRGQIGNSWESESGKNLTFSFLIRPTFLTIRKQFLISKIVSLAVARTLSDYHIAHITIKWPNDIYFQNQKIAGILIENSIKGQTIEEMIIGIGLNVNQTRFHSQAPNPVSMKQITGLTYDLNQLLESILDHFFSLYQLIQEREDHAIDQDYLDHLFQYQQIAQFKDDCGVFTAKTIGISNLGELILERENGDVKSYSLKEVKFILPSPGNPEGQPTLNQTDDLQ